jgi:hypothetical protein
MSDDHVPPDLLSAVARDLRPVRPLPSPVRRALVLLPLGLALLVGVPLVWGWRSNLLDLGSGIGWGLSGLQALAGLFVVAAGLREAVPGRELRPVAIAATLLTATILFLGITIATRQVSPRSEPPEVWVRFVWECFWVAAASAVPALAAAAWLASRALPTRPWVAGSMYGLGAGLMADAGVRLYCWVSTPSHVLVAHGGALLAMIGAGALIAVLVDWTASRTASRARPAAVPRRSAP